MSVFHEVFLNVVHGLGILFVGLGPGAHIEEPNFLI
jgi:hypothetical protein